MSNIKSLIEELNSKLIKWSEEYYLNNKPSVSDLEYDAVYQQYSKLVLENPSLEPSNSILKQVGFEADNRFKKIEHAFPMLSLSNAFDAEDMIKFDKQIKDKLNFFGQIKYVTELKIDGLSISLIYKNGKLVRGVTRGNGVVGEDVTHNIKEIKDIPHEINYKNEIEFRGEIYMLDSVFEKLNQEGNDFANPRNAASGTLRQLDSSIVASRQLSAFIYSIPNPLDHGIKTHHGLLEFVAANGFKVNPEYKVCSDVNEVNEAIANYQTIRSTLDYETDGVVIKVDDITKYEDIGFTVKFPKFMIAYKFPEEVATTTLLDIFPTVGRTGRITYNAKLAPVRLAGTTVTAATLHNADYIREIDINIGDVVKVKKAAEIIPKVLGWATKNNSAQWEEVKVCPACGHTLHRFEGEVDQYCINEECPQRNIARLEHFVSRNAMDIDGISTELLKLFISEGLITDIPSLFDLPEKQNEILALPRFKEKSVSNIVRAISNAKVRDLDKFIFALGIRHVGEKNALLLSKRFGTLENLMGASQEDISSIRDLGPKVSEAVVEFFGDEANKEMLEKILAKGLTLKENAKPVSDIFASRTFVITGTLSKPRKHFQNIIESNGGNVSGSVTSKTDYVLVGEEAGSKLDKARELNINVLDEQAFEELLKGAQNE